MSRQLAELMGWRALDGPALSQVCDFCRLLIFLLVLGSLLARLRGPESGGGHGLGWQ